MKVVVENPVSLIDSKGQFLGEKEYANYLFEFNHFITLICNNKNEDELRRRFRLEVSDHFLFGFSRRHMWVKQIIDGEPRQQVIFVEF
jgi:hypothetical protein